MISCLGKLFDVGLGLCGQPSLSHTFKGNKSIKILISTIFFCFRKLLRPILFNLDTDRVAEQ